mmetsp:Transcript_32262/g.97490  ORF Transcript_32262/g.97490 Transcript_32262/m.97490 type:complete len:224 (-) Transcript_32262:42-713(-)
MGQAVLALLPLALELQLSSRPWVGPASSAMGVRMRLRCLRAGASATLTFGFLATPLTSDVCCGMEVAAASALVRPGGGRNAPFAADAGGGVCSASKPGGTGGEAQPGAGRRLLEWRAAFSRKSHKKSARLANPSFAMLRSLPKRRRNHVCTASSDTALPPWRRINSRRPSCASFNEAASSAGATCGKGTTQSSAKPNKRLWCNASPTIWHICPNDRPRKISSL